MYCLSSRIWRTGDKIEKSMPGWFLRQGAEFSAKYHEGKLFEIKPLVYSYLDDDEILRY